MQEIPTSKARRWFVDASAQGHGLLATCPPLHAVTGTDGKSTTVWVLHHVLSAISDQPAARSGTLGWHDGTRERPARLTTPPADQWHHFLASLDDHCPGVALEASSIGLDQYRLGALPLRSAIITNFGSDHLDYHGSLAAYHRAKLRLLDAVQAHGTIVLPAHDPHIEMMQQAAHERAPTATVHTLGRWTGDYQLTGDDASGWQLQTPSRELLPIPMPLPGEHNAWNAAAAVLALAGSETARIAELLPRLTSLLPVPGRLEKIGARVFVDYAHTAQGLHRTLSTLRNCFPKRRLICVFGCGGDRDQAKRPAMGQVAQLADRAYVTADNPRSESVLAICQAMVRDLAPQQVAWPGESTGERSFIVEPDRGAAIARAKS